MDTLNVVKERIKKLLMLASGGTSAEAELAMMKAQELMDQHRVTMLDIELSQEKQEKIIKDTEPLLSAGRIPGWKKSLAATLAQFNDCRLITYTGMGGHYKDRRTDIMIYGKPSNIEYVRYLLSYLIVQLTRYAEILCMGEGHKYKDSWYNGAVSGIYNKISEGRISVTKNLPSTALVKFNDELKAVDDFISQEVGKLRKAPKSNKSINSEAFYKGFSTGKSIDTGDRKSLPKEKKALGYNNG